MSRQLAQDLIEALSALKESKQLIDSSLNHVSHGGPTKLEAQNLSDKIANILSKYPNLK